MLYLFWNKGLFKIFVSQQKQRQISKIHKTNLQYHSFPSTPPWAVCKVLNCPNIWGNSSHVTNLCVHSMFTVPCWPSLGKIWMNLVPRNPIYVGAEGIRQGGEIGYLVLPAIQRRLVIRSYSFLIMIWMPAKYCSCLGSGYPYDNSMSQGQRWAKLNW